MISYIAKCGCSCIDCPTYKDNIRENEQRIACSLGWRKYLNINLSPEKLRSCDGCSLPDSDRKIYYLNCKVRKCCMVNDFENCAYCSSYPCNELIKVHSLQNIQSKEDFTAKTEKSISATDYKAYVEPYTGLNHLNKIREQLKNYEIKEFKKFSTNKKFKKFSDTSKLKEDTKIALKIIYALLTSIDIHQDISYARYLSVKERRKQLLRIIWIFALFGELKENNTRLELSGKTFLSQKIPNLYLYERMIEYFSILKEYKIDCEIIPLNTMNWLSEKGILTKEGWILRMEYGHENNDKGVLYTLKNYVTQLDKTYKKNSFKYFNSADFGVLIR